MAFRKLHQNLEKEFIATAAHKFKKLSTQYVGAAYSDLVLHEVKESLARVIKAEEKKAKISEELKSRRRIFKVEFWIQLAEASFATLDLQTARAIYNAIKSLIDSYEANNSKKFLFDKPSKEVVRRKLEKLEKNDEFETTLDEEKSIVSFPLSAFAKIRSDLEKRLLQFDVYINKRPAERDKMPKQQIGSPAKIVGSHSDDMFKERYRFRVSRADSAIVSTPVKTPSVSWCRSLFSCSCLPSKTKKSDDMTRSLMAGASKEDHGTFQPS